MIDEFLVVDGIPGRHFVLTLPHFASCRELPARTAVNRGDMDDRVPARMVTQAERKLVIPGKDADVRRLVALSPCLDREPCSGDDCPTHDGAHAYGRTDLRRRL